MQNTLCGALLGPILVLLSVACFCTESLESRTDRADIQPGSIVPFSAGFQPASNSPVSAAFQPTSNPLLAFRPQGGKFDPNRLGTDYLADVTSEGKNVWPSNRMPLKVYIEDGTGTPGYRDSFPQFIRNAFTEWQGISKGKVSWQEVNSPNRANIICSWTAQVKPSGNGVEAGETQTMIRRFPFMKQGTIVAAHVYVLTSMFGRPFSDTETYKTCLHEVGHSLGLQGHSRTVSDIMYATLNPYQVPYLTGRDGNTITALYSGANPNYMAQQPTGRQYFPGQPTIPYGQGNFSNNPTSGFAGSNYNGSGFGAPAYNAYGYGYSGSTFGGPGPTYSAASYGGSNYNGSGFTGPAFGGSGAAYNVPGYGGGSGFGGPPAYER